MSINIHRTSEYCLSQPVKIANRWTQSSFHRFQLSNLPSRNMKHDPLPAPLSPGLDRLECLWLSHQQSVSGVKRKLKTKHNTMLPHMRFSRAPFTKSPRKYNHRKPLQLLCVRIRLKSWACKKFDSWWDWFIKRCCLFFGGKLQHVRPGPRICMFVAKISPLHSRTVDVSQQSHAEHCRWRSMGNGRSMAAIRPLKISRTLSSMHAWLHLQPH